MRNYFISAYATSPSGHQWDEGAEQAYFEGLAASSQVIGIEHPFLCGSEKYPIDWLVKNVPEHWQLNLTSLPAAMQLADRNPRAGLASTSEPGRKQAVALIQQVRSYGEDLQRAFGRQLVKSINLYSSPKNTTQQRQGSQEALKRSLAEIVAMDWGRIALNLEHCDALTIDHPAEKGFLSLEEEISVLESVGGIGLVLNWGRSAIEARSNTGPLLHIRQALEQQLLQGFVFSGCTDDRNSPYGAWKDSHTPPAVLCSESLLGKQEISQVFDLLNKEEITLGVKVSNRFSTKNSNNSIALNIETIVALEA